jgi:tRNA A-37 threonylcarbamoyl transferase component Bud32
MPTRLIIVEPVLYDALKAAGLSAYDDFLCCEQGRLVHETGTTKTRHITFPVDGETEEFFLKAYRYEPPAWLTLDKARREALNYVTLRNRCGVKVPDVIAFGSRRRFGRLIDAFILTRAIPHAIPLDRIAAADALLRRYLLDCTSSMVSRMHTAGFCHIDLQWRNLLVSNKGSQTPEVYVIDSARGGLRQWSVRREQGRLRDLSSLYKEAQRSMTSREQLRWLRAYFGIKHFAPVHRAVIHAIRYDRALKDNEKQE